VCARWRRSRSHSRPEHHSGRPEQAQPKHADIECDATFGRRENFSQTGKRGRERNAEGCQHRGVGPPRLARMRTAGGALQHVQKQRRPRPVPCGRFAAHWSRRLLTEPIEADRRCPREPGAACPNGMRAERDSRSKKRPVRKRLGPIGGTPTHDRKNRRVFSAHYHCS